jgi:lipid-binding SYLF domain-containing protein
VSRLNPEKSIPSSILKGAKGLAVLTVAKAGAVLTYKMGTGLVVARRSDGSWSAPSAILSVGLGWGVQVFVQYKSFFELNAHATSTSICC